VDLTSKSIVPPSPDAKKSAPPAVHIHHKFVLIDAETSHPIIYTGSNNMSHNSTYNNDENLLEITECPRLAQIYLSEFIRLYEHYRARAVWDMNHPKGKTKKTAGSNADLIKNHKLQDAFTLKTTRDEWVKAAYKKGSQDYLMRTRLANPS
jgi:phosphatidylserine/phosphatidylglycerophosphate/cardiolipin synthase-like enzyme